MGFEEFYNEFEIRRLDNGESIAAFTCGDDDLDDFILNDAPLYRKQAQWLSGGIFQSCQRPHRD